MYIYIYIIYIYTHIYVHAAACANPCNAVEVGVQRHGEAALYVHGMRS